jgi:hypothetical protein
MTKWVDCREDAFILVEGRRELEPLMWCAHCGVTRSSIRRKGPEGDATLCNSCGIRYSKVLAMEESRKKRGEVQSPVDAPSGGSEAGQNSCERISIDNLVNKPPPKREQKSPRANPDALKNMRRLRVKIIPIFKAHDFRKRPIKRVR